MDRFANRLIIGLCSVLCILYSPSAWAWGYSSTGETREDRVQLRMGADFTKKWNCGVRLSIAEELRFDLYDVQTGTYAKKSAAGTPLSADTTYGAAFEKSYTTINLAYHPIDYFKVDAGYTLRILGRKTNQGADEFLRHRVFFGVTGMYTMRYAKLYVRERVVCDMRTDSVNLLEKNRYQWELRSRIGAEFIVPGQPVKPYTYAELHNTLNAPEYQRLYGRQYISKVRAQAGVKWRLTQKSSLDFYYRFTYGYDRDINITKTKQKIQLTEGKTYQHAIGITYHFNY